MCHNTSNMNNLCVQHMTNTGKDKEMHLQQVKNTLEAYIKTQIFVTCVQHCQILMSKQQTLYTLQHVGTSYRTSRNLDFYDLSLSTMEAPPFANLGWSAMNSARRSSVEPDPMTLELLLLDVPTPFRAHWHALEIRYEVFINSWYQDMRKKKSWYQA